jgi:competence protein ComGF
MLIIMLTFMVIIQSLLIAFIFYRLSCHYNFEADMTWKANYNNKVFMEHLQQLKEKVDSL